MNMQIATEIVHELSWLNVGAEYEGFALAELSEWVADGKYDYNVQLLSLSYAAEIPDEMEPLRLI